MVSARAATKKEAQGFISIDGLQSRIIQHMQEAHDHAAAAADVGQIYSSAGRRILRFMRSVPRFRAVLADFLSKAPFPTWDACLALGRRLQYICEAWRRDVPERMYHAVLCDAFVVQVSAASSRHSLCCHCLPSCSC